MRPFPNPVITWAPYWEGFTAVELDVLERNTRHISYISLLGEGVRTDRLLEWAGSTGKKPLHSHHCERGVPHAPREALVDSSLSLGRKSITYLPTYLPAQRHHAWLAILSWVWFGQTSTSWLHRSISTYLLKALWALKMSSNLVLR